MQVERQSTFGRLRQFLSKRARPAEPVIDPEVCSDLSKVWATFAQAGFISVPYRGEIAGAGKPKHCIKNQLLQIFFFQVEQEDGGVVETVVLRHKEITYDLRLTFLASQLVSVVINSEVRREIKMTERYYYDRILYELRNLRG